MLYTSPFTAIEQGHLMQPFVHRITERTVEVAVEGVGSRHASVGYETNCCGMQETQWPRGYGIKK